MRDVFPTATSPTRQIFAFTCLRAGAAEDCIGSTERGDALIYRDPASIAPDNSRSDSFPEPFSFSFPRTPRDVLARSEVTGMTEEKQRTLEGLVVTDKEALKEAVREVLREEGILGVAKAAKTWDRTPKGDAWW